MKVWNLPGEIMLRSGVASSEEKSEFLGESYKVSEEYLCGRKPKSSESSFFGIAKIDRTSGGKSSLNGGEDMVVSTLVDEVSQ